MWEVGSWSSVTSSFTCLLFLDNHGLSNSPPPQIMTNQQTVSCFVSCWGQNPWFVVRHLLTNHESRLPFWQFVPICTVNPFLPLSSPIVISCYQHYCLSMFHADGAKFHITAYGVFGNKKKYIGNRISSKR